MKLFVPREREQGETRVAMSVDIVKKLTGLGFDVSVERDAGELSRVPDSAFEEVGATIGQAGDAGAADVIFKVRRPTPDESHSYKKDALVLASMDPFGNESDIEAMANAGICGFSMEFMPRISRAQVMDVLSSQANLAGYQSVIEAAAVYDRALPMMMTAAGTVPAARVFVMGAGVAGLQAIATARRLGAIVTATDVRPAAKEQVESLGAKFIAVEDDEFKQAETSAGYAKEMSKEYQQKQADLVASHIAKQDIVITTALIPGRPAPRLVSKEMMANMSPGSVLVDLAVERGGNVEGAIADEVAKVGEVSVIGFQNMVGRIGASASALYAKNLYAFLETMVDKESSSLSVDWDDELVVATLLTRNGDVVHPAFIENSDEKDASDDVDSNKENIVDISDNSEQETTAVEDDHEDEIEPDGNDQVDEIEAVDSASSAEMETSDEVGSVDADAESEIDVDDLTRINGIGENNAEKLIEAGISSFAQIAAWTPKDEEEFGERFAFPGRIEREEWVSQAKQLMDEGDS